MTQNGHYAVQGHSVINFGTNWKPVYDFLYVDASNLHKLPLILHHVRHMADYLSNFRGRQEMPLFNGLVGANS